MTKVKVWPNGDYSAGCVQPPPKIDREPDSATAIEKHEYWSGYKYLALYDVQTDTKKCDRALARVRNERQAQKRRGLNGITSYGRKMLRNSAYVLQRKWTRKKLSFGTATLPTLSGDDLFLVNSCWEEVVRRFFEELGRLLLRKGLPNQIVHCTEIQESRFKKTGEYCPHLHWVMPGRLHSHDGWAISKEDIRNIWERILSNLLKKRVEAPFATRVEQVRRSASNYLSKYISKGCKSVAPPPEYIDKGAFPHSWHGETLSLKRIVKSLIITLENEYANDFIDTIKSLGTMKEITVNPVNKRLFGDSEYETTVGYYGQIRDSELLALLTTPT